MNISKTQKTHRPKVSIGMPVYNGEKFVRDAINFILAQTFTNFELIISDNASSDSTEFICREYVNRDPRIKYIRQNKNMGAAANFQFVLDEAVGDYFMWAAADDKWLPAFISECYAVLEKDINIGFVVTKYAITSRFSPLLARWRIPDLKCVTDPDRESRVWKYSKMPFDTHKDNLVYMFWRRKVIADILAKWKQATLNNVLIGASMNEYALSLYRGGFIDKMLYQKRYPYLPSGHILVPIVDFTFRIIHRLKGHQLQTNNNPFNAEQHYNELRIVLKLAGFGEGYISRIIEANKYHIKFRKACKMFH